MSRRCVRPECGGEQHTDPWGTPVQCPHAEPVVQADTGRRCPRCDCPDGHEQCQHCKVCPHARQTGDAVTEQPMTVTRVHAAGGSHIEPDFDPAWDEVTKLRWHAAVVAHDTGLAIELHQRHDQNGCRRYGVSIGALRKGGQLSISLGRYSEAWDALNFISLGAEAFRRVTAHEEVL